MCAQRTVSRVLQADIAHARPACRAAKQPASHDEQRYPRRAKPPRHAVRRTPFASPRAGYAVKMSRDLCSRGVCKDARRLCVPPAALDARGATALSPVPQTVPAAVMPRCPYREARRKQQVRCVRLSVESGRLRLAGGAPDCPPSRRRC